ncbi:MAG: class I SAM-dependent methyltransferase [Sporichthyaceae bacterium]
MFSRSVRAKARVVALRVGPLANLVAERDAWRRRARAAERKLAKRNAAKRTADRRAGRARTRNRANVCEIVPPGHFYSPIPDLDEVRSREAEIFARSRNTLPGIELHAEDQLALLPAFADFYAEQPFAEDPSDGLRYGFRNGYFSYGDGLALYCMLRQVQPSRFIEVGSGWSSALALDVNDRYLDGGMDCTFIEPFPERLDSLLRPSDRQLSRVISTPLHEVPAEVFASLASGDLLFIDSTHVSRVGSDVNRLFLEIVPALAPGVHVHVHDVFWPFEYPAPWIYEGKARPGTRTIYSARC